MRHFHEIEINFMLLFIKKKKIFFREAFDPAPTQGKIRMTQKDFRNGTSVPMSFMVVTLLRTLTVVQLLSNIQPITLGPDLYTICRVHLEMFI